MVRGIGGEVKKLHFCLFKANLMNPAHNQRLLIKQKNLQKVNLPPTRKLKTTKKSTYRQRQIKRIWNNYGGLLENLSKTLKIDTGVGVAVLCVESKGRGFAQNGRMIIRFENHVFWKFWGKSHPSFFSDHFRFNPRKPWQGHKFRKNLKSDWTVFHRKGQSGEWGVFEFARSKHQRFAMYSISMGMPQIMGFNHKRIGYKSAKMMFDSFSRSERNQIIGLFNFIAEMGSNLTAALKKKNFFTFAKLYNGPGRAKVYADRIKTYYDLFKKLI